MNKFFRTIVVITFIVALILSLAVTGCSRKPNEKQCQAYEEQLKAANSAEDMLQQKKQDKADLEKQLDSKQGVLEKVKSEKENIENKLGDV
ncbi:MAG TPA: hypothetical protein ENN22_06590 [bacterium]|nr:hypothetical protein [bacterium]